MKYKRQLMSGMLTVALLASGASVFAADISATNTNTSTKSIRHNNQMKMKSEHKKTTKTHHKAKTLVTPVKLTP